MESHHTVGRRFPREELDGSVEVIEAPHLSPKCPGMRRAAAMGFVLRLAPTVPGRKDRSMRRFYRASSVLVALSLASTGCFRGGGLFAAIAATAIVTAVVVSSRPPPPPRVVIVPEPRPGFVYQPGYWTLYDDQWVWVEGTWVSERPGYVWVPAHWEGQPDGRWRLEPGQWVPAG